MSFAKRLKTLRKAAGLTQDQLAEESGINQVQLNRYEKGRFEPRLDMVRNLAIALGVTADELLFEDHQREPDEELMLLFDQVSRLDAADKRAAKALLEGLVLRARAKKRKR